MIVDGARLIPARPGCATATRSLPLRGLRFVNAGDVGVLGSGRPRAPKGKRSAAIAATAERGWRPPRPGGIEARRPARNAPMSPTLDALALPLFVPADRPDRFAKAFAAGADAVIIDLEDAVAPDRKAEARAALLAARDGVATAGCPVLVRVNPPGTPWHAEDLAAAASLRLAGIVLPKAEAAEAVAAAARAAAVPVLALIESAGGVAAARKVARAAARAAVRLDRPRRRPRLRGGARRPPLRPLRGRPGEPPRRPPGPRSTA